jgi:alpha-tubulin suppressor-like RCC1 family protein
MAATDAIARAALLFALTAAATGCRVHRTFACEADEQCVGERELGRCEPAGYCSFADASCPGGRRYDELAGGGLAGTCVGTAAACIAGLAGGEAHACAVTGDGGLWCWGRNAERQLTGALPASQCTPARIASLDGQRVQQVAAGRAFTCVRIADDSVRCFGDNTAGQIGNGGTGTAGEPTAPVGLPPTADLDGGDAHACAAGRDGGVYCWGRGNEGQLGAGAFASAAAPVRVEVAPGTPLSGATRVATGGQHSCAVAAGALYCWGRGDEGQLGDDTNNNRARAVMVATGVVDVAAGSAHTCMYKADHTVWCWGAGGAGRLGRVTSEERAPVEVLGVPSDAPILGLAVGVAHGCALGEGRGPACWGDNAQGQIAEPAATMLAPTLIADVGAPTLIAALNAGTCTSDGATIWCRGTNTSCELGQGSSDAQPHPRPVMVAVPCD